jgi:hypothetical protein
MDVVNSPVATAAPSSVWLPEVVGFTDVLQHTPCCVGLGAPRSVIFPLPVAVVAAILETAWVVTIGAEA